MSREGEHAGESLSEADSDAKRLEEERHEEMEAAARDDKRAEQLEKIEEDSPHNSDSHHSSNREINEAHWEADQHRKRSHHVGESIGEPID